MTALKKIRVQARIVLAQHRIRMRELLKLERGSVVMLGGDADRASELHVNGAAVALGQVRIEGDRTCFAVTDLPGRD